MPNRALSWALFALALAAIMHPWISTNSPLTVNHENIPEINYIWLVRDLIEQGQPFSPWQPKPLGGEAATSHLMYPFYWLVALASSVSRVPPESFYKLMVFLVLLLGCGAMSEFLRRLTGSPAAGIAAGLVFALIPGHMNSIEGFFIKISWLAVPLIFWLYEREFGAAARPGRKGALRLGLAAGLMALASVQIPLMMLFILPPYVLFREWQGSDGAGPPASRRLAWWWQNRGRAWLVVIGVALGLSAAYYLPALIELDHLSFSRLADEPGGQTVDLSFLLYLLGARWLPTFSAHDLHQVTWYIGGVALLLAILGLTHRGRRPVAIFFGLAGLLSLLLLTGDSLDPLPNVVFRAVDAVPVIRGVLRHSFRWILPLSLSLAVLAGLGAARLAAWSPLAGSWRPAGLQFFLAGLLVFDYFPLYGSFQTTPSYLNPAEAAAVDWLNGQEPGYRYFTPFAKGTDRTYDLVYTHHLLDRPGVWDDQYVSHFVSKRAYLFFAGLNVQYPVLAQGLDPLFLQMLNLGAVRYLLLNLVSTNHAQLFRAATSLGAPVAFARDQVRILINPDAKSMVQLYPESALYQGDAEVGEETAEMDWLPILAPRGIVLLDGASRGPAVDLDQAVDYVLVESQADLEEAAGAEQAPALTPAQASALPLQPPADRQLQWRRPDPTRAVIDVRLAQPSLLVFAEAWYPGWHVYVDGIEKSLLRANYAFQGVFVPAGQHTVVFAYRLPLYTWLALGLSTGTLLIALAGLARRRPAQRAAHPV